MKIASLRYYDKIALIWIKIAANFDKKANIIVKRLLMI